MQDFTSFGTELVEEALIPTLGVLLTDRGVNVVVEIW